MFFNSIGRGGFGNADLYVTTRLPLVADHFTLSAPASTTAGQTVSLTLTAWDHYGNIATGYTGTVTFASSDPQATLPARYTFTAADNGTHTFDAALPTAGAQSIKVTDPTGVVIGAYAGLVVNPAPAVALLVSAPSSVTAGNPFTITVSAMDPYGNVDTNYNGTVTFTSSDAYPGVLPGDYSFTAADNGTHTFAGVTLFSAGAQTLTTQDTANGPITGSATVAVVAAPADHFLITSPSTAVSGTPFDVTVTALDPYGNVDTNYAGTTTWASSDADQGVVLPADYTFQANDNGTHNFLAGVALITPGDQTLTATDTGSGITGSATVTVTPGPHAPPGGGAHRPMIPTIKAELIQDKAGLLLGRRKHNGAADDLVGAEGATLP
jgi:S-adenosylmethionine hydrolase